MTFRRFALATIVALIVAAAAGVVILKRVGLAADRQPNRVESYVARHLVQLAIPSDLASAASPVAGDPEAWRAGADNFKGRCAVCHGADGRGRTDLGPKMYPPVPDLASAEIQQFSDGQLFAIVRHGVSWTGMPAFRSTLGDEDIWQLVAYVRQVPKLTSEDPKTGCRRLRPGGGHRHGRDAVQTRGPDGFSRPDREVAERRSVPSQYRVAGGWIPFG